MTEEDPSKNPDEVRRRLALLLADADPNVEPVYFPNLWPRPVWVWLTLTSRRIERPGLRIMMTLLENAETPIQKKMVIAAGYTAAGVMFLMAILVR